MKKSIIAILLVFSLLFGFAACRKIEKKGGEDATEIQSDVYIVDENGSTHNVQAGIDENGSTQYFYIGENGEEVTVAPSNVVVETKAVKKTEAIKATNPDGSLTPEAQSLLDQFNDPSSIEQLIDNTSPAPTLAIGETVVDEKKIKKIKVDTDKNGKPLQPIITNQPGAEKVDYKEILSGDRYTASLNLKTSVNGGTPTTIPITVSRNGNMFFMQTLMPISEKGSAESNFLLRDNKCYLIIPSMRCYYATEVEEVEDIFSAEVFDPNSVESTFISRGEIVIDGVTYICDTYESNGQTVRYLYLNGTLKRIEIIDGQDSTIMEIRYISRNITASNFEVPSGYLDMAKLMGEENTAA